VDQLQALVRGSTGIKAIGARHSFSDIQDSHTDLVSLDSLPPFIELDRNNATVTVNGSMRYGDLGRRLNQAGLALHNMASLPHISVAGACATATHGSGDHNRGLASAIQAVEWVGVDGSLIQMSRTADGEAFNGVPVSLGALGIITRMTLAVEPAYSVRQLIYNNLPFEQYLERFDEMMGCSYSVSLIGLWSAQDLMANLWVKEKLSADTNPDPAPGRFGGTLAGEQSNPIYTLNNTPGSWNERLPHFRYSHNPSSGSELQSEYFIPRKHAVEALVRVRRFAEPLSRLTSATEIRTIAADDLWMSPYHGRDSVAIHFTWEPELTAVMALLPTIEAALAPFDPRPHWGKLFVMTPEHIQACYPRLTAFRDLARRHDPGGKFHNSFLKTHLGF
jgi:xylitol oxidase